MDANARSIPNLAAPPRDDAWVVDRGYARLALIIWGLGYAYTLLLPLMSFRMTWAPPILLAFWILFRRFTYASAVFANVNVGMTLLLGWCMLSAMWSPLPGFAFTQAMSITGISLIALAFSVSAWNPLRFERALMGSSTAILVASLVLALLVPGIGHDSDGLWRGVTYQKNGLGQAAVIGLLIWTYLWAARKIGVGTSLAGIALSVLLLIQTWSSTSLILGFGTFVFILLQLRPPLRSGSRFSPAALVMVALPTVAILVALVASNVDFFAQAVGKDATFTGRTQIWSALFDEIRRHPALGTGFSSYWSEPVYRSSGASYVSQLLGWQIPNGHNGYIDLVNEVGLVGLALFAAFVFLHIRDIGRLAQFDPQAAVLHRTLLLYVLLANLSETGLFHPVATTHVLLVYSSLEVSRRLFERRLRTTLRPRPDA